MSLPYEVYRLLDGFEIKQASMDREGGHGLQEFFSFDNGIKPIKFNVPLIVKICHVQEPTLLSYQFHYSKHPNRLFHYKPSENRHQSLKCKRIM